MWAVVPVKDFTDAKGRLSEVLSPEQRQNLARAMIQDVLGALMQAKGLDGVAVMTRDAEAQELCSGLGARILTEDRNAGQTSAVMAASLALKADGIEGVLTVPGDVPLISPSDIETVLAQHGTAPAMTIVPARDYQGSNCVVCSPPGCVPLRFGDNSYYPHLEAARQAGIKPLSIDLPNLGLDIDTPEDLAVLIVEPVRSKAQEYLVSAGVTERQVGPDATTISEMPRAAAGSTT